MCVLIIYVYIHVHRIDVMKTHEPTNPSTMILMDLLLFFILRSWHICLHHLCQHSISINKWHCPSSSFSVQANVICWCSKRNSHLKGRQFKFMATHKNFSMQCEKQQLLSLAMLAVKKDYSKSECNM